VAARRKKHEEHEEHVNHERWLVTYADMITLLMVLFIVLYSMGQTDLAKYEKLRASLSSAFGGGAPSPLEGGAGVLHGGTSPIPMPGLAVQAQQALQAQQAAAAAQAAEEAALEETKAEIGHELEAAGLGGGVGLSVERRGLVVSIASDKVLFEAGQAALRPEGREVIARVAGTLVGLPNRLHVEGHTDDVPISGQFASNWELSTARATTVLQELVRAGVTQSRLSATGFADQQPIASNGSPDGRARNRRVAILVEATTTSEGGGA
jgi:chemotaxis protein MotB